MRSDELVAYKEEAQTEGARMNRLGQVKAIGSWLIILLAEMPLIIVCLWILGHLSALAPGLGTAEMPGYFLRHYWALLLVIITIPGMFALPAAVWGGLLLIESMIMLVFVIGQILLAEIPGSSLMFTGFAVAFSVVIFIERSFRRFFSGEPVSNPPAWMIMSGNVLVMLGGVTGLVALNSSGRELVGLAIGIPAFVMAAVILGFTAEAHSRVNFMEGGNLGLRKLLNWTAVLLLAVSYGIMLRQLFAG